MSTTPRESVMTTQPSLLSTLAPIPRLLASLQAQDLFSAQNGPIVVARGPGRLDVMGGIADYSGSLVCELPLAIATGAAVQTRHDGLIVCRSLQTSQTTSIPAAWVLVADPLAVRGRFQGDASWARYAAGCMWWLAKQDPMRTTQNKPRMISRLTQGVTILVDSDIPIGAGVSSSAALEVAVMSALTALFGIVLSPLELAAACQNVENLVVGAPCGVMDQVTSTMGADGSMMEILCQPGADGLPAQVKGPIDVPPGMAFVGINSGVRHAVSGNPYIDTRVSAFIGQKIIADHLGPAAPRCLANLDAGVYERELRPLLPERITGADFLARYQKTNDPVTTVVADKSYHARSATDHHVYEMRRVTEFVALLKDKTPTTHESRMIRAGQLMDQSHHSYGQCALMGHAMTDLIADMARDLGPARGFYGAKITGGGCGGTVAILLRDRTDSWDLLAKLRADYEAQSGRTTHFFRGTSAGATTSGTMKIELQESAG